MSDYFADSDTQDDPPPPEHRRRPRPLLATLLVMVVLVIGFTVFADIWTQKLWFGMLGYSSVFNRLLGTKALLFAVFGLVMALSVGINLWLAFRVRPAFWAHDAANLTTYRQLVDPVRRALLLSTCVIFGVFAGITAIGKWRIFMLWRHRQEFGKADPYFHKDIGFYVFTLPWLHFLVDFLVSALVIGLLAALLVHYLYGGIRLQDPVQKVSGGAQAHLSVLIGLLLLLKGVDYWLDRYDLTSAGGGLVTGMTYTRQHAVLPAKNILMFIAVICALVFFANVLRRTWLLPGVGIALFLVSALLLGAVWPGIMQRFQVKPDEPDKEAPYIANNIAATRAAFDLEGVQVDQYDAKTTLSQEQLKADTPTLPGIRLVDPQIVSDTFEQLQQVRGYYSVPSVLDVDRYDIDGQQRDVVIAARELNQSGLPAGQRKWPNLHTVYTHGYGVVAAFGNQRDAADQAVVNDGNPVWAEKDLPPTGSITDTQGSQGYRGQIYFGEGSPDYSIVGQPKGGKAIELDIPQGNGEPGQSRTNTYTGKDGVPVGGLFNKLLYATKFGDANMLLSSRVNSASKILYDRSPRERAQEVAPWLTFDSDALPAVVDHKIVWVLDGYTTSNRYPLSEKRSLQDMTSDSLNPRATYATLPTDEINYMRNPVKVVVDAYDGTVKLYEWGARDPILKAWESAFPGVVKPKSEIPKDLLAHLRYPEDLYKVQRDMLASYHVLDPKTFYEGNDKWEVPEDPSYDTRKQPPFRLTVSPKPGESPKYSLTSVYVPYRKQNLASFMSVGADGADPSSYGKFTILRLPDNTQVAGPGQIANQFQRDDAVAQQLLAFKREGVKALYGNLLTLPVGGGLLYVQPLYTTRAAGSGNYPGLSFVLVSFGQQVGIGSTLSDALDDVLNQAGGGTTPTPAPGTPTPTPGTPSPSPSPSTPSPSGTPGPSTPATPLPTNALKLLQQADQKFAQADKALKAGDLNGYAKDIDEARALVKQALQTK